MTEPEHRVDSTSEVVQHPVESAKNLAVEAGHGHTARTPAIAISGVTIAVSIIVAIVLIAAVIAYVVA